MGEFFCALRYTRIMRKPEYEYSTNFNGKEIIVRETENGFQTPPTELAGAHYKTTRYTFPKNARVYIAEDNDFRFRTKTTSKLICIDPPGTFGVYYFDKPPVKTEIKNLLGRKHAINPDGSYHPRQLLDSIQFAEEVLGYTIEEEVMEALGIGDENLKSLFGEE
jgi:hypothetical protein